MNPFARVGEWLRGGAKKSVPATGGGWPIGEAMRRHRAPSSGDLLAELKGTAWACASINAAVCASHPPRLFAWAGAGADLRTRALDPADAARVASLRTAVAPTHGGPIVEVFDHPLLDLLRQVNPAHNGFDLWELTQLSLEVHGAAYWLVDVDPLLGHPCNLWPLPTHLVTPLREAGSTRLVDAYEYRGSPTQRFAPERVIHFRHPDPRDPYASGLSPLRACYEQAALTSEFATLKRTVYENAALPSVLLTPEEGIAPEERERLEHQWRERLMRGGPGRVLVADGAMQVTVLSHSIGDLAALADVKASKEDIANAFHVPLPFLSGETNLANLQAADHLHKTLAIVPRIRRRDEKLNEQLVPRFDTTGRLFVATPDPTPANQAFALAQEQSDLRWGVRTVNEVRAARGLPPVAWGHAPFSAPGERGA